MCDRNGTFNAINRTTFPDIVPPTKSFLMLFSREYSINWNDGLANQTGATFLSEVDPFFFSGEVMVMVVAGKASESAGSG